MRALVRRRCTVSSSAGTRSTSRCPPCLRRGQARRLPRPQRRQTQICGEPASAPAPRAEWGAEARGRVIAASLRALSPASTAPSRSLVRRGLSRHVRTPCFKPSSESASAGDVASESEHVGGKHVSAELAGFAAAAAWAQLQEGAHRDSRYAAGRRAEHRTLHSCTASATQPGVRAHPGMHARVRTRTQAPAPAPYRWRGLCGAVGVGSQALSGPRCVQAWTTQANPRSCISCAIRRCGRLCRQPRRTPRRFPWAASPSRHGISVGTSRCAACDHVPRR